MDSHLRLIWTFTWGIRSDLEGLLSLMMFPMFSEEAPKWSVNSLVVPVWAGMIGPVQHTHRYPLLSLGMISSSISALISSPGLLFSDCLFGAASCRFLIPTFSLILGVFWSFWNDCFAIASDVPGIFLPAFCCSRLETKRVLSGFFPYLWRSFSCYFVSLCSLSNRW